MQSGSHRTCTHCHSLTPNWLWRLVEPSPRTYEVLCTQCATYQDATFTADAAIGQAIYEVWIWSSAPVKPYRPRLERTLRRVGGR